jgi:hypothetical protein
VQSARLKDQVTPLHVLIRLRKKYAAYLTQFLNNVRISTLRVWNIVFAYSGGFEFVCNNKRITGDTP